MSWSRLSSPFLVVCVACSPVPDEVRHPEPEALLVRVSTIAPAEEVHRGSLIFADADSLVIADRHSNGTVAVRDTPERVIQIYRGQRVTVAGTAKTTGKSALLGMSVGLLSAAAGAAAGQLLGMDVDVSEALKAGVVAGAVAGVGTGMTRGANEGDPVWQQVTVLQVRQQLCRCPHP